MNLRPYQERAIEALREEQPKKKIGRPRVYTDEERAVRKVESQKRRDAKYLKNLSPEQKLRRREADKRYSKRRKLTPAQREQRNARIRRWRANLPAETIERIKAYKRAYNKTYELSDKQRVAMREHQRKKYQEKKAAIKEKHKAWHAAHPEAARVYAQNRRERKRQSGGALSRNLQGKLMALQKNLCTACRCDLSAGVPFELDHITPLAKGGAHDDSNIQLLCMPCNRSKAHRDPVEFMQARGFLL